MSIGNLDRRTFVGALGLAAGAIALGPLASAVRAAAAAPPPSAAQRAWTLDELPYSYPLYAEAIPYSRPRQAEPAARADGAADPLEHLLG